MKTEQSKKTINDFKIEDIVKIVYIHNTGVPKSRRVHHNKRFIVERINETTLTVRDRCDSFSLKKVHPTYLEHSEDLGMFSNKFKK